MTEHERPEFAQLVSVADAAAVSAQCAYYGLARTQLAAMLIASLAPLGVLVYTPPQGSVSCWAVSAGIAVLVALLASLVDGTIHFQDRWYAARALAESTKTESWRYAMKAGSYGGSNQQADAAFFETVHQLKSAGVIGPFKALIPHDQDPLLITDSMKATRAKDTSSRLAIYIAHRVNNQHKWYLGKAAASLRSANLWQLCASLFQVTAVILVVLVVGNQLPLDAIGAATTAAASALAWSNMKDFRFHASSYANIAEDLGRQANFATKVKTDAAFVQLVDDVEHTISREHTMWVTRKH